MTTPAVHPRPHGPLSRAFAYGSFAVMVGGWVVFFVALVASRQALDDAWTAVRELPLLAELAIWLLGFPFLLGLAIWQASWDEALRLAAVAVLAGAYIVMFLPRKRSA